MRRLSQGIPSSIVAVLTIISAVPSGLDAHARFLLMLLPFLAICHWRMVRPQTAPAAVAFASGLGLDVLTHGPLGYWSLVYLVGHALAGANPDAATSDFPRRWLMVAGVLAAQLLAAWSIASLYFMEAAEWWPLLIAGLAATVLYPLLSVALRVIDRPSEPPRQMQLARAG